VNPMVCTQIGELTNQSQWVSVIANGGYQELPEPQFEEERAHARKQLEKRSRWWLNALPAPRTTWRDDFIEPLSFRVHIDSVTGLCGRSESEQAGVGSRHEYTPLPDFEQWETYDVLDTPSRTTSIPATYSRMRLAEFRQSL